MGLKLSSWCAWLSLDMLHENYLCQNFIFLPIKHFSLNLILVQTAVFPRELRFLQFEIKTFNFLYTFLKSLKSSFFLFRHVTNMLMVKSVQFFTENPFQIDCVIWSNINEEKTGSRKINKCSCCDDTFKCENSLNIILKLNMKMRIH